MLTYYSIYLNTIIVQEFHVSSHRSKTQNNLKYDSFFICLLVFLYVSSQELFH